MEMQRAWPWTAYAAQIPATVFRRGVRTWTVWHQAPSRVTAGESAETLRQDWSLKEDCFRQGPRGPEYYYSPEGGGEKKNRRINENVETHNQEDVNAWEPRDKTAIQDKTKCLRTNYGPITSCGKKKRPKAGKLDRLWLLFVDCSPLFLSSVSSTLSWYWENK